jgi:hypothetical protein
MPTVICRTCGESHQMGFCSPGEYPFCGPECEARLNRVVDGLMTRMPIEMLGVGSGDRVYEEAGKEVIRMRAREFTEWRDGVTQEWIQKRPRRVEPVAKRYFSY